MSSRLREDAADWEARARQTAAREFALDRVHKKTLMECDELRAEVAHLRAHVATLPIALAPVPPGDKRPAVMGGECSACHAAPPYHEATCERRTAPHDLTPSQVAVAVALDAWWTWSGDRRDQSAPAHALRDLGETFKAAGLAVWNGAECVLTDDGRALLARARAAGVLGVSTEERAAWARLVLALLLDARAVRAAESEKWAHLAKEWSERADAEAAAARQALRDLGVDVDALLSAEEGR